MTDVTTEVSADAIKIPLRTDYVTCRAQMPPSQRTAMHRLYCNTIVPLPYDGGVVICPRCGNVVA